MARLCVDKRSKWMLPSQGALVAHVDKVGEVEREAGEAQEVGVVLMERGEDMVAQEAVMVVAEVAVAGEDQEEHPEEDMVEREAGEVMVEREAEEDKTMEINNLHTNLFQHQTVKLRYRNEWILQTI